MWSRRLIKNLQNSCDQDYDFEYWDKVKLYNDNKGILISLFSPFYDDLTFISKYSISCYKKIVEEAENFNKMILGNNKWKKKF